MKILGQDNSYAVREIDKGIRNLWKWAWLDHKLELFFNGELQSYVLSQFFKKKFTQRAKPDVFCAKRIYHTQIEGLCH